MAAAPQKDHAKVHVEDSSFHRTQRLRLSDLPQDAQEALRAFDEDGNGDIDVRELQRASHKFLKAKEKIKRQRGLIFGLGFLIVLMLLLMGLIMLAVIQLTKESNVQPDGVLVTAARDGRPSEVVQTASFQSAPTRLHSALPDEAFEKLKIFSANSTVSGSHVSLQVLGFARVQGPGICGNVVEILTAAGQITLDGATMTFASEVGDVFVEAGFILDASRRRLGDAQNVMLLGLFSYFMAIDGATLTCRPPDPAAANSASVPTSYHARIARYRECGHSQMPGWCTDPNLGLPRTVTHPDFPGKRYFKDYIEIWDTGSISRIDTTYGNTPGRVDTTIRDTSTGFSRSAVLLSNGTWANCASSIETAANLTRGGFASLLSDMNPQRDGTALVNGTTARQFTFTMTSGIANVPGIPSTSVLPAFTPIMRLSYYDSEVAPHLPRRIRFEDLYPNQPPEYADNYVLDVELFEPVTVFPQGTFAVSAPATCDALLAAAPPQAYPSELSVRFLTNAEIAALEVAAGINGTADAIVATGGRRRLQRLAGRVASNQRDLQSGRSVSGCVNMYGNNMVRLPRVVTLVTIQGAACTDTSFDIRVDATGTGRYNGLSGYASANGCFRCNPGGGLSSIDGGGCISLNIGYDQWPTSMQLKCQNRQCLNSRCRTNSETFTAEQTCRSRYSIQLGNICAEKRSDRVRFAAFVGVSAYSSSIRAGAGAQFDHYFEPISCPWFSGRSSPCTNNFRLYLQANLFDWFDVNFDVINETF